MANIHEQIRILVQLQGVDGEIYTLTAEKERIPQIIQELEDNFKAKQESIKTLDEEIKAVHLKRKDKELELATKEEEIKKSQTQLYAIKTNKEYHAKLFEIEGVKAGCSLLEEDIIKMLEGVDSINQEIKKEKENLTVQEKVFLEEKKKHQARLKEIEDRLAVLDSQRKQVASQVEPKILKQYDKVLRNRGGVGIALAKDEACQGCFMSVAPQVINEIKMNKSIIACPACQRILYLEEIVQN